jgi:integrase/recombinase XerD
MKTTNTFGVKFITRPIKNKPEEHNIYARIINKKRLEISLKQIVNPLSWDSSAGCLKGNKELARQINPYIEEVRYKLTEFYRQLQRENKTITAETIKNLFLGEDKILNTLCTLMEYRNVNMKSVLQPGTALDQSFKWKRACSNQTCFEFLIVQHVRSNDNIPAIFSGRYTSGFFHRKPY